MTQIRIFEVGPRDGLQNERVQVSTSEKKRFVLNLQKAGLREIEVGLFVRPDRVPQMKDSDQVVRALSQKKTGARIWSLVPNPVGMQRALACGAKNLAVFTGATETFVRKNIGMSISESLRVFEGLTAMASSKKYKWRGYLSTAFGCPYEGRVKPKIAIQRVYELFDLGVDEVSIGDTIGVASPRDVEEVLRPLIRDFGSQRISGHFHDTRGTALANALRALDLGVGGLDASAGGLGGCPFAPGARGNLATEDLVYMLERMGVATGVDLDALVRASERIFKVLKKPMVSRYAQAHLSQKQRKL